MVTSGNSSSSSASTSPIERCPPAGGAATSGVEESTIVTFEEDEAELADLEFVTVTQDHAIDTFLVDVGAVQRAGVGDHVAIGRALDLGMPTRHGDVVEADLGLGVPAESGGGSR